MNSLEYNTSSSSVFAIEAPDTLAPHNYEAVMHCMATHDVRTVLGSSLIAYVNDAFSSGVNGYYFTAYSAIPLADYIRGFYIARGEEVPQLDYIDASYHKQSLSTPVQPRAEKEVGRLKNNTEGITKAAIIDQYTCTGKTLEAAAALLNLSGLKDAQILLLGGQYYQQATGRVDHEGMTSEHSVFMLYAGKLGALTS